MAGEDDRYLDFVRRSFCCAPGVPCMAMPCEPHHPRMGVVGAAQRGHDRTAIPLCALHHRELHTLSGAFKGWDGRYLREWQQDRITETQERVDALMAVYFPEQGVDADPEMPF